MHLAQGRHVVTPQKVFFHPPSISSSRVFQLLQAPLKTKRYCGCQSGSFNMQIQIRHFPTQNLCAVSHQLQVEAYTPGGGIWGLHALAASSTSHCPLPSNMWVPDRLVVSPHSYCACFCCFSLLCLYLGPSNPSSEWGQNGVMSSKEPSINPSAIVQPLCVLPCSLHLVLSFSYPVIILSSLNSEFIGVRLPLS